jgi:NAD(P)-dependent dehydrogenase (short-subunit alcohol dehydrogenase family)
MKSGVLIVTGASRGIGAAIARLAARNGFEIAINFSRDESAAKEVASYTNGAIFEIGGGR